MENRSQTDVPVWSPSYTRPKRLEYNGYVVLDDVLEHQDEVRSMREFANMIAFVTTERSLRCKYPEAEEDERERVMEAYLKAEGERIRFLDSLGFAIGWPLPLSNLVEGMNLDEFRRQLRVIEKHLPELHLVDLVYILDEPNFRDVPVETLEAFIDAFKEVFPGVKTWFCYAIVHPQFLDAVPPRNADWLGIDPYMFAGNYANTAADFEAFYRESLACALEWVNRWEKPFLLAGDCFYSRDPNGKRPSRPETALWYYQLAMTQPKCVGLIWFYYGNTPIESENLKGFNLSEASEELAEAHRSIGEAILREPSPLGLQRETFGPAPEM